MESSVHRDQRERDAEEQEYEDKEEEEEELKEGVFGERGSVEMEVGEEGMANGVVVEAVTAEAGLEKIV